MKASTIWAIALVAAVWAAAVLAEQPATGAQEPKPGYAIVSADVDTGEVTKFNRSGESVWTYAQVKPIDAWPMDSGAVLIAYLPSPRTDNKGGVRLVSSDKQIVFDVPFNDEIMSCQPLPNGNILVNECDAGRITEMDRQGKPIRSFDVKAKGMGHRTARLIRLTPQNTVLVAECYSNKLREYDFDGRMLKEWDLPMAFGASRLQNGNTLIAGYKPAKVVELAATGETVWSLTPADLPPEMNIAQFGEAVRLPGGNTLVACCSRGVKGPRAVMFEVTPDKKVVWKQMEPSRSRETTSAKPLPDEPTPATPVLELRKGEKYFRLDGTQRLVLGRNPTAISPDAFAEHFKNAAAAGETFLRIHFCYMPPNEKAGEIHPDILKFWDAALDAAEKNHLAVMPVCGVWADWNDGSNGEAWHAWDKNPFNVARGGPARSPAELFEEGACRTLWMKRLETLVQHWQGRRCIVAWEIFSELDLLAGSTEEKGVAFVEAAAKVIRAADRAQRPVTSSLAGAHEWPRLFKSDAVDLVQVHPYGDDKQGDLDELILRSVRQRLTAYGKPVLIGECGLDWRPPRGTLDVSERAPIGIRHAIWAAMVSGSMNARSLWWQDGYDQFEKADLCRHYQTIAVSAAQFVKDVDYSGLAPVECEMSAGLRGAMLGSAAESPGEGKTIVGWFRDARCVAPNWPVEPTSGQWVVMPARDGNWTMEVVDPESGKIVERKDAVASAGKLRADLAEFRGSAGLRCRWTGKK